jgi:hypothetical protein
MAAHKRGGRTHLPSLRFAWAEWFCLGRSRTTKLADELRGAAKAAALELAKW